MATYAQCGGRQGTCGQFCYDMAWKHSCCGDTDGCLRQNEWCAAAAAPARPLATPPRGPPHARARRAHARARRRLRRALRAACPAAPAAAPRRYWQCLPRTEIANQQAAAPGKNVTVAYLRISSASPVVLSSSKAPQPRPSPSPSPAAKPSTSSGTQAVTAARKYPPMPPTKRG